MKLVVGLGNYGKEYEKTRHNIGFIALDNYLSTLNSTCTKKKFNGLYCDIKLDNETIIFLKPLCFMNNSGIVIKQYLKYFNISLDDLLIIYDDLDIEVGEYKLKTAGGTAGHNGLKSIEENLQTKNYKRIKIGISKNNIDKADYVLGKFNKEQYENILKILPTINLILTDYTKMTFENLMNKYN